MKTTKECDKKLLSNKDIKSIYENKERSIHSDFSDINILNFNCPQKNIKTVELQLMDDAKAISSAIVREYYQGHKLFKKINDDEKNNVAYHKVFVLDKDYRGKGIAEAIHKRELTIYALKNIKEIHTHAVCDGVITWVRLGFNIVHNDSKQLIYESLMTYLEVVKKLPDKELDEIEGQFLINDYEIDESAFRNIESNLYFHKIKNENRTATSPEEYIEMNFTTWFFDNCIYDIPEIEKNATIAMYKELQ